ncbi:MAG: hypothetical protein MR400_05830 [Clostridiales bacterium]|nr:hypothetical protein [Clostridiales bacterium]
MQFLYFKYAYLDNFAVSKRQSAPSKPLKRRRNRKMAQKKRPVPPEQSAFQTPLARRAFPRLFPYRPFRFIRQLVISIVHKGIRAGAPFVVRMKNNISVVHELLSGKLHAMVCVKPLDPLSEGNRRNTFQPCKLHQKGGYRALLLIAHTHFPLFISYSFEWTRQGFLPLGQIGHLILPVAQSP